jgi:hypothetical protein
MEDIMLELQNPKHPPTADAYKAGGTDRRVVISLNEDDEDCFFINPCILPKKPVPWIRDASSVDGVPTIGRAAEATPGGSLSARDDTSSIGHFIRPVNPSEASKITDENGEPKSVFFLRKKNIFSESLKQNAMLMPYIGV